MKTFYSICQALDITPNYLLAGSRYSFTGSEEYTRVCEEIAFLLKDCDDKQISAAGRYHTDICRQCENKETGCMYGRGKCRQLKSDASGVRSCV